MRFLHNDLADALIAMTARRVKRHLLACAPWLLSPLLLLALWEAATHGGGVAPEILVPPEALWRATRELLASSELQVDLIASAERLVAGFLAGSLLGISIGLALAMSTRAAAYLEPLFEFIRQVPTIALVPPLMLVLGVEDAFKITVVAKATLFPLGRVVADAVRYVPARYLEVATAWRLTRVQRLAYVVLPSALPATLVGLRSGLGRAWTVLVFAELLAADRGIGEMLQMGREMFRIDVVMVGVVLTGVIGVVLDTGFRVLEQRLVRWHA